MARVGLAADGTTDPRYDELLSQVSSAYDDADRQRYLHDRAFLLASTEMQQLYDRLREASESAAAVQRDRLKAVFDTAATGLIVLESDGHIFDLNPVAELVLGLEHDAMIGAAIDEVLTPADPLDPAIAELRDAIKEGGSWRSSDTVLMSRRGRALSASMLFRAMRTGGGVLAIEDITERKQAQAELLWRANHDSLTGLLNRPALIDQINRALQRARRYETHLAVMFIDLDRFKRVNDTLGHAAGDLLLVECARRISAVMREVDTVARLGGDEFVTVCENLASADDARDIACRVAQHLGQPFSIEGEPVYVEASVGIAMSDGHDVDPDGLLRDSDVALYEAKQQSGPAVTVYTESMIRRMQHSLELERRLRNALPTDEFWVAYQPIFALPQRQVVGFEALARWSSQTGPIGPDEFIPAAEAAGLLDELGRRLIRRSLQFLSTLPRGVDLFLNLSPAQLSADGIVEWLTEAIRHTEADPSQVVVEITETAAVADNLIIGRLHALRDAGLRIGLDDFGVGHSSLAALRSLPLDLIKVDRSFLVSADRDPRADAIARMICQIGQAFDVPVIAEGIETQEQLAFLADIGCVLGQGFLLATPAPPDEAIAHLGQQ
jgi:diguanylate cyclase (GGDEF)-like protein/PAS domain S-box-containing protein